MKSTFFSLSLFKQSFWKVAINACALVSLGCVSSDNPDESPIPEPERQIDYYFYVDAETSTVQYIGRGGTLLTILTDRDKTTPHAVCYQADLQKSESDLMIYPVKDTTEFILPDFSVLIFNRNEVGNRFDACVVDKQLQNGLLVEEVESTEPKGAEGSLLGWLQNTVSDLSGLVNNRELSLNKTTALKEKRECLGRLLGARITIDTIPKLIEIIPARIGLSDQLDTRRVIERVSFISRQVCSQYESYLDTLDSHKKRWRYYISWAKQSLYHITLSNPVVSNVDDVSAQLTFSLQYDASRYLKKDEGVMGILYSFDTDNLELDAKDVYCHYVSSSSEDYWVPGKYSADLIGLIPNKTYYCRTFFTYLTGDRKSIYSEEVTVFNTPGVVTGDYTDNGDCTATVFAEAYYDRQKSETVKMGICFSAMMTAPTVTNGMVEYAQEIGYGSFEVVLSELDISRRYYYRAFLETDGEYTYGEVKQLELIEELRTEPTYLKIGADSCAFEFGTESRNVRYDNTTFVTPGWVTYNTTQENGKGIFNHYFSATENPNSETRIGEIRIYGSNGLLDRVSIEQEGKQYSIVGKWNCTGYSWTPTVFLNYFIFSPDGGLTSEYFYPSNGTTRKYGGSYSYDGASDLILYKTNGDVQHWTVEELAKDKLVLCANNDGFLYYFERDNSY